MILFLIFIIAERVTINSPYYPEIQTPDKSPLEFTFEPGLGLAMIYWPDAIINIADETMSKKISILDDKHVFTFGRQTSVTISFRENILFYVFEYPKINKNKLRNLYPICKQYFITPSIEVDDITEVYFTAYGRYYVNLDVSFSSGQVTVEYELQNNIITKTFEKTFTFEPEHALKDLKISSTAKFQINSLIINCTQKFESQNSHFVAVEVYRQARDMSRVHVGYKDDIDNSILISEIKPRRLYTLGIDTTEVESEGFEISYKYSPDDNEFIKINNFFYIESTKYVTIYLYSTSLTSNYPNCKNSPFDHDYYTSTSNQNITITKYSLPSMCRPQVARITIFQNISELDFYLYYMLDISLNRVEDSKYSLIRYSDFNISLLATRWGLCDKAHIKTLEVKVGQSVTVNITNDDMPRACIISDKNSICFSIESDYQKCLDAVEGRVIQAENPYYNPNNLYDPGANYTMLLFKNMSGDSSIFKNQHDVIFGPNCFLNLHSVNQISGSQETRLIIDNLTFDPSNVDRLEIYQSKHIKFLPSTGQSLGPIMIRMRNDLILEALDDKADQSKYPDLIFETYSYTLNLYDYPIEKISKAYYIINGAYIICNYESESSNCPRDFYNTYKIHNVTLSAVEMKIKSILYIFLDTFDHNIDIDINKFNNQKIYFVENTRSNHLLEEKPKVRFISAKNISFDFRNLIISNGTHNTLSIDYKYNDSFTVVCEDYLTVSNLDYMHDSINVEPIDDNSIIYFDSSIKYPSNYITMNVDMKNIKKVNIYYGNKEFDTSFIYTIIQCGGQQCNESNLNYKCGIPPGLDTGNGDASDSDTGNNDPNDSKNKDDGKNGLGGGAIAGIVIVIVVVIAAVIVAVIFVVKKKKNQNASSNENDDNQENKEL